HDGEPGKPQENQDGDGQPYSGRKESLQEHQVRRFAAGPAVTADGGSRCSHPGRTGGVREGNRQPAAAGIRSHSFRRRYAGGNQAVNRAGSSGSSRSSSGRETHRQASTSSASGWGSPLHVPTKT